MSRVVALSLLVSMVLVSMVAAQQPKLLEPVQTGPLGFETLASGMRVGVVEIKGSGQVALTALLPIGGAHDPAERTGFAALIATALELEQEQRPAQDRLTIEMRERTTVISGLFPIERLPDMLRNLEGILQQQDLTVDQFSSAKARTLLEIDNGTHVYPGPILRWRAQQVVFAGTPLGRPMQGIPEDVEAITREDLAERTHTCYAPGQTVLCLVGVPSAVEASSAIQASFANARRGAPAALVTVKPKVEIVRETVHPHVGAPFVTLALQAPGESLTENLPFVIALQIVHARAARAFGIPRHGEMEARFPYMFGSFWEGSRLILLNRRGRDGDDVSGPKSEIEELLFGLRDRLLSTEEISAAAVSVGMMLTLPPYSEDLKKNLRTQPRLLPARSFVWAAAELLGWPQDLSQRVGAVKVGDVGKGLVHFYDPARWHWLALVPK